MHKEIIPRLKRKRTLFIFIESFEIISNLLLAKAYILQLLDNSKLIFGFFDVRSSLNLHLATKQT